MFLADVPLVSRIEILDVCSTHLADCLAVGILTDQIEETYCLITKHVLHKDTLH